ncbi:phospho-N-acetylmuramoyl-pentapeptide-transferase [Priestia megaterium]|nr:phospho-N-acetylmuramoyl-pentapeptide-transferase [Priestia megaterium]
MFINVLLLTTLLSFILSMLIGPLFIKWVTHMQFKQSVREEGPTSHKTKQGTPIFGGFIFLLPLFILSLFLIEKTYAYWFVVVLTFGYAFIGFIDDFLKVARKHNGGLTPKQKIVLQLLLSIGSYLILMNGQHDTSISLPGLPFHLDLSYLYFLFFLFITVGTTNATNLTDGLDGLLGGLMAIALAVYSIIAFQNGQTESMLFASLTLGSLLGFLMFNRHPAKIFMGDTGSLALGGLLAGIAVLTKTEFLLVIIGGVFVAEALSVLIQVTSYKRTGKRIFKMAPLHHHYELTGWSEQRVVSTFYIAGMILGILAVLIGG